VEGKPCLRHMAFGVIALAASDGPSSGCFIKRCIKMATLMDKGDQKSKLLCKPGYHRTIFKIKLSRKGATPGIVIMLK
jgi:hypothetical protein